MSYVTESTAWLSDSISQGVRDLIARFYELADSRQSNAGALMASEVFTHDGIFKSSTGTHTGAEEIAKSRENAWSVVVERKHVISRAFASRREGQELVLIGSVRMKLINEKSVESGFASHIRLDTGVASSAQPRMAFMEVFADGTPVAAALGK